MYQTAIEIASFVRNILFGELNAFILIIPIALEPS